MRTIVTTGIYWRKLPGPDNLFILVIEIAMITSYNQQDISPRVKDSCQQIPMTP
jgi:hypothetical protein